MSVYEIAYFVAYNNKKLKMHLYVRKLWLIIISSHLYAIVWLLQNKWSFFKSHYAMWCHTLYYLHIQ